MTTRVQVKGGLLRWARERAGIPVDALIAKFPRLPQWELEEASPTLKQLEAYAKACPPEDVGGVGGYMEFLQAIHDPTHDEHVAMWEWGGGPFDPTGFDRNATNAALRKLRL